MTLRHVYPLYMDLYCLSGLCRQLSLIAVMSLVVRFTSPTVDDSEQEEKEEEQEHQPSIIALEERDKLKRKKEELKKE